MGHASFLATSCLGQRILIDPCRPGALGGRIHTTPVASPVDVVLVSHYHEDHGWIGAAPGDPVIVDRSRRVADTSFKLWTTAHDSASGCRMGLSRSMRFKLDRITVLHTGDLGEFDDEWLATAAKVDVLLLPVGGVYTLAPERALALMDALAPRWCIPMHYQSSAVKLDMATRDDFVALLGERPVTACGDTFHPGLPPGVILLDPATQSL